MSHGDRDRILTSLELALGFPTRDPVLAAPEGRLSQPGFEALQQPWDRFQEELARVSGRFHVAKDVDGAREIVLAVIEEHSVRSAMRWEHQTLESLRLDELLEDAGVEILSSRADSAFFERAARADMGISAAHGVLVESGTIVVKASAGQARSVSLLPPVHLAVVKHDQRMESVLDLPHLLRGFRDHDGRLPSAFHLITGPSRTADIEITIVLGVHGPRVLHVLALDLS
ncbi:MAG: LutC/YkgG family protein [Thermodesulfobacteriota bacterium]